MPLTQANQQFGTGSQESWRQAGYQAGGVLGNVPNPNNRYGLLGSVPLFNRAAETAGYGEGAGDVAAQYNSLFGTMTPQQRVSTGFGMGLPAGAIPAQGGNTFANGGGANNAPAEAKATPQQAGQNNSIMPGWSNGNPDVGVAKTDVAFDDRTATDPLNVVMKSASVTMPTVNSGAASTQGANDGNGTVGEVKAATTDGTTTQGSVRPDANNWGLNISGHGPGSPITPTVTNLGPNAGLLDVMKAFGDHPYLNNLAQQLLKLVDGGAGSGTSLASLAASGQVGNGQHGGFLAKIQDIETYLNSIAPGLNWHPSEKYLGASSTPGTVNNDGTGNNDGTTTIPAPPPNQTDQNGDVIGGPGGEYGGKPAAPGTNLDRNSIEAYMPAATARVNALMGGGVNDPKYKPFITAMIYQMAQTMASEANTQQGINIYGNSISNFKNDPLRLAQTSMMQGIMANPDNTPWDTIRNNTISDANKAAQAGASAYGASAARRLGSAGAGAMPGVYSDIQRNQNNYVSRQLGDLDVRKAAAERDAQYRALSAADALRASTTGADVGMAGTLAGMEMGVAPIGSNPMAGLADAWVNSNTYNKAANQSTGGPVGLDAAMQMFNGLLSGTSYSAGGTGANGATTGPQGAGMGALAAMFPSLLSMI